jgi:hypothetical protein
MTPANRIAELGQILATGFRRLRLSLDGSRRFEAQCNAMNDASESNPARGGR